MERTPPPPPDAANSRAWTALALGLVLWQAWLTLSLFGSAERLLDDDPVLSGRHPLHLYHGHLGAQSFLRRGTLCCFDPAFAAGYPKTPVFDSGSRPAELFLLAGGGAYRPAAYKVGLALCCLLPPLLLTAAARGAGLSRAAGCLATAFGVLVWWGQPCRDAVEAGDLDLLLAALASLAQFGLLLRFDRAPSFLAWCGLLATGFLTWFAHPLFSALLVPLTLVYYLSVGARHGLPWHLALAAALGGAVGGNAFWLRDWLTYLWMHSPFEAGSALLPHRTFHTVWSAPLWGRPGDRALALFLVAAGLVGVVRLNLARRRAAARVLGLGSLTFLMLAVVGIVWEPLGRLGTAGLLTPALLFAAPLAAHGAAGLARLAGGPARAALVVACLLGGVGFGAREQVVTWLPRYLRAEPLALGLGAERLAAVETLKAYTTGEARVLWEERTGERHWTALLPVLTEGAPGGRRSFLGGLDPGRTIDHNYAVFSDQTLAGRPIGQWADADLLDFCRRYNVGWVACWSPAARARFRALKEAGEVAALADDGAGALFALKRTPSFALKGKAQWLGADGSRVALGDVVPDPETGTVVLSLHYQAGLRAVPSLVKVEREIDSQDPIPFVRLRLSEPATRVTLTWEK